MTTVALAPRRSTVDDSGAVARFRWMITDTRTIAWRYIRATSRMPEAIVFSLIQPIMFVLLFRYVFGGAVNIVGNIPYVDYLMPGIFSLTVLFGSVATSVGLAEDLQKGLIERFRALPMTRSAVLAGRTISDLVRNIVVMVIMVSVAFMVGFRVLTNPAAFLAGVILLLLFAWTLSWGFAVMGLSAPNSETANIMAMPILLPFTFASSTFVQVRTMPGWLRPFAANQPVSMVVNGARALMAGGPTEAPVLKAIAWCVGLLVVFAPLAVYKYRRAAA